MYFEEFRVGRRFTAGPRVVTEEDLVRFTALSGDDHPLHTSAGYARSTSFGEPVLQGSFGAAVAAGLWTRLGLVAESIVAAVGESWTYHHPIKVGDELSLAVTIVRLQDSRGGGKGLVTRYNELLDGDGTVLQSGTATALVRAGDGGARPTNRDVGTVAWGKALADTLTANPAFTSAVASWDGTIGLRGGEHEVHLRVYRGRIIDVTRRSPHGATFTFGASDKTWADLLTAEEGRFGTRLMTGEFASTGDPYEYLRLTKALEIIVDAARELAARSEDSEVPA
ncbi:MaoC/PaaZ C-terminal domain-containing protein [Amycolatopsis thermophila]|uniref:Acyl dehydratase/putative sterol carrier protein n=1 Tax=Amycolatopsis thermophila TaxID=206084 RepID=A0ABU0EYV6_9PSEU|nr:MaoC/PaaZ C-terminal domain-containing protein [Amycolatopsis thermophila]MDQ0380491.1 acyl dehydratase/putative sterol carrier protein [Amycolatopsis thermophila]